MLKQITFLSLFFCGALTARDVLLEFKGAGFFPTNSCFKDIYGKGAGLYGAEVTFHIGRCKHWYGFASIDFLSKKGHTIGLCTPTKVHLLPLGFGVKYFVPFCYGDFYVGLGFQPTRLKTINCSVDVPDTNKWGFGGIAKIGSYFNLPCNFLVDLFVDYSFVKVDCVRTCQGTSAIKANVSGIIFGAGLGYRF